MEKPQRYTYSESVAILQGLAGEDCEWDRAKMKLKGEGYEFRLPWPCPPPEEDEDLQAYAYRLDLSPPPYYMVLIQAGHSALGYFEAGEAIFHKVIKKYMVRAKQGKAQIGYLSTRGKSKAGSRIRLANTVQFFEEINGKLEEWAMEEQVERILLSCPIRMLPLLYGSKVPPPFQKGDPRIFKVPLDVNKPDSAELARVAKHGNCGYATGTLPL